MLIFFITHQLSFFSEPIGGVRQHVQGCYAVARVGVELQDITVSTEHRQFYICCCHWHTVSSFHYLTNWCPWRSGVVEVTLTDASAVMWLPINLCHLRCTAMTRTFLLWRCPFFLVSISQDVQLSDFDQSTPLGQDLLKYAKKYNRQVCRCFVWFLLFFSVISNGVVCGILYLRRDYGKIGKSQQLDKEDDDRRSVESATLFHLVILLIFK